MNSTDEALSMLHDIRKGFIHHVGMRRRIGFFGLILAMALVATAAHAQACPGLKGYSTNPFANTASPPCGWPSSAVMQPSQVDDSARQNMADLRAWYDDAQWINPGYPVVFVSGTAFQVSSSNPSIYHVNRRIKAADGSGNLLYGTIVSVTDQTATSRTVILRPDAGLISNTLANVWYGAVGAVSSSVVSSTLGLGNLVLQPDRIVSDTTQVVANAAGSISLTTSGTTHVHVSSSGLLVAPTISVSTVSSSLVTSTLIQAGGISATYVSATGVTVNNVAVTPDVYAHVLGTATISTTSSSCSVTQFSSMFTGTCTRLGTGTYAISGTFPNNQYQPVCTYIYTPQGNVPVLSSNGLGGPASQQRMDGFFVGTAVLGPGSAASIDNTRFKCTVLQ